MLGAISPLDGRYAQAVKELSPIFSEAGLMRYRVMVEIEYLIALGQEAGVPEVAPFSVTQIKKLRQLYLNFNQTHAKKVKQIEKRTNHDVKAIEYYLKENLNRAEFKSGATFVHFGLTSEDVNNLAYSKMLQDGVVEYLKSVKKVNSHIKSLANSFKNISLLSLTHGQPASPTTVGKELAVFVLRLNDAVANIESIKLSGKFAGATGNWNAHMAAYPKVDWLKFSQKFVESLGLKFNPLTTQIEPHDNAARMYQAISLANTILRDLDQDIWFYISRGIFKLKKKTSEVGSSTMPHKVNPIDFENSEGNAALANSILLGMAVKLPVSRLQRDLSDSTTLRNQGIGVGYSLLACKNTLKGLHKLDIDRRACKEELENHYEVLGEVVQTVMKKYGHIDAYEQIKKKTRGRQLTKALYLALVKSLDIPKAEKQRLLKLTPANYIGLAAKLVDKL
ncbi:MAG: adenylosuccinate lyase [Candidatus Buchananbacteria bacterium CG10_big_fil_rev_8_21_14_0_10_42_9]|uniref:Adenylosuccinate lyase n=1 Tax=Candidatus Buchananbacteria bacterium CG10_big_fil_rev_8_21_14_0_10_42_9 TaxID=1974526 RepID=A0A2H0W131_9BACT|nr:MAG: adenylosuccinate lyase [Candidatus Buchananbacteria bacterium CG10_big_fil_rev_8_21_14_0_10_42_9]